MSHVEECETCGKLGLVSTEGLCPTCALDLDESSSALSNLKALLASTLRGFVAAHQDCGLISDLKAIIGSVAEDAVDELARPPHRGLAA